MNILNCFKIVPDIETMSEEDIRADENLMVDTGFVKSKWNCYDESALEMLLKLSEFSEGFNVVYELNALTIGTLQCGSYLKTLYALGYKKGVCISCAQDIRFQPDMTSWLIAEYVKKEANIKVVVMGRQSEDEDSGKTPLLVAEKLQWPCITQVIGIEADDEQHLKIYSKIGNKMLTQIIRVPVVLAIGDAPNNYLRVPTLKDRMKVIKQPIEIISAEELLEGFKAAEVSVELISLNKINQTRAGFMIEGDSLQAKMNKVYEEYVKQILEF
ncbi:electron transfer flavoprotein subunit beta/FixA family protein [Lachnospiraceae bacterium ZAX-1]